jgi:exosortase
MTAPWKKWTAAVPGPFLAALLLGAGFLSFVAWDQSHWWRAKEDYSFGWLVPLFVAFVVHDRWPRIAAALRDCAAADSPRATGGPGWLLGAIFYTMLVGGAGLFLIGALYRAGNDASYPGTLAITLGASALLLATLFINAPEPADTSVPGAPVSVRLTADARVRLVAFFVFPALVWLVSAPMVSIIENNLSVFLLNRVMAAVFFVFDTLGIPVRQEGNVLVLPPFNGLENKVGVEQACSGIRSFTGCLFAGSFLAAVFLEQFWKKVLLVSLSILFAFGMNILRALFLTAWAYRYGEANMEESVHDIAGYAVLGLTVAGLLCLLPLLNLKVSFGRDKFAPSVQGILPAGGDAAKSPPAATANRNLTND